MTSLLERSALDRRKLLMDRSRPGRIGTTLPPLDVPASQLPDESMLRDTLDLPEVSEGEIVRYFSQISQFNFSIDHNFYPLGSCTMKYNPKLNDEVASLPGFSQIHPLQPVSTVPGGSQTCMGVAGDAERNHRHGCVLSGPYGWRGWRACRIADGSRLPP